jgi:8-amino-7-oxononanoate synthase
MARETLSGEARAQLLQRLRTAGPRPDEEVPHAAPPKPSLEGLEFYRESQLIRSVGSLLQIENPYFQAHEGAAGAETLIGGTRYLNFS